MEKYTDNSNIVIVSVLTLGKIRRGIEKIKNDRPRAEKLRIQLGQLRIIYANRLLGIDEETTLVWGELMNKSPHDAIVALLAATALVNDLTLVSRNEKRLAPSASAC